MSHTILLLQRSQSKDTRTFMDYETVESAMEGLCGLFEKYLKQANPNRRQITYDIASLYGWMDNQADLSALVFNAKMNAYIPYNKQWIKDRALAHLRKQVGQ